MPNHVSHRLFFAAEHAPRIFEECCPNGGLDFDRLISRPINVYSGNLTPADEKDFPCNWHSWSCENWGTKWNAYEASTEMRCDRAVLKFQTAWRVPYPVIVAFANRYRIPFEHWYYDEGNGEYSIERWDGGDRPSRVMKRKSDASETVAMRAEFGHDAEDDSNA